VDFVSDKHQNVRVPQNLGICLKILARYQTETTTTATIVDGDWKLLLISQRSKVGVLPGCRDVYKISRVVILSLSLLPTSKDLDIEVSVTD